MRRIIGLIFTIALFLLYCGPANIDIEAESGKIKAILERYEKGLETKDRDILSELWAHDSYVSCIETFTGRKVRYTGWTELDERTKEFLLIWQQNDVTVDVSFGDEKINISPSGKNAWLTCILSSKGMVPGGKDWDLQLLTTIIFEKRNDKWLIVHFHDSGI